VDKWSIGSFEADKNVFTANSVPSHNQTPSMKICNYDTIIIQDDIDGTIKTYSRKKYKNNNENIYYRIHFDLSPEVPIPFILLSL